MSKRAHPVPVPVVNETPSGPEVKLRVAGGSYAGIVRRLPHPHGPDFAITAKGLVHLLETNHFDAALMVVHNLADLMDDFELRQKNNEPG